ncbi:protein MOS2-like [Gastrolobium bilobum]|uniref:protein MOS2-like n=1 Tax=Gastrolobium bilobum TaxID=150636 RepID=UPI002AB24535|nr:protein MOS2-like [Gastrolobium bilobum]
MKLSFSLPSKSSSKSNPIKPPSTKQDDDAKSKDLITEFDPSKPPTGPKSQTVIIPPIQNQWRPSKDSDDGDDYRHRVPPQKVLLQKFKDDLKRLPDDEGLDEFKDVPVEGFGAALLAGYGWSEGMAIGKKAKEDVKVVQYERRAGKEGLGFVGDDRRSKNKKKDKEEGEGGTKESGKIVRIVGGRDAGSKASVVRSIGDDWLVLKISRNGEQVKVKMDDVAELGSIEEERCLKEFKIQRDDKDKGLKNKHKHDRDDEMRGHGGVKVQEKKRVDVNGDRRKDEQGKRKVSWLTNHIRVRVISRDFKGGRLYLKKGEVLDVVGPSTCDISMDESKEIVQGVSQDLLETAIPRCGGPVLVLYGKHKGAYGRLIERDLDREIGIVRDVDTHELLNVKLEQIAEYVGDPSFLGH